MKYQSEALGFECPICGRGVVAVYDKRQAYIKGAYCDCGSLAATTLPVDGWEWARRTAEATRMHWTDLVTSKRERERECDMKPLIDIKIDSRELQKAARALEDYPRA